MRFRLISSSLVSAPLLLSLLGCCPSSAQREADSPANVEPAPSQALAQPEPEPVAELTPEQQQQAAERQELERLYAELDQQHQAELARLTPEIRAAAKALAEAAYENGEAAIRAALTGPHRQPGNPERDAQRHALETLSYFGFAPNQHVLEYGPGGGWYTELLAPALAKQGMLSVAITDPNGPRDARPTYYGKRTQLFLDRLPEAYGKVGVVSFDPKAPSLPLQDQVDMVLLIRSAHGMHNNGAFGTWLAEFHRALKPNGVLGIVQHRAKAGANPDESGKQGYLPEQFVIDQVVAAGFRFEGKSEINANPKDTAEHPHGVWSLPPTLRGGDVERANYAAIGESDRMTLKFVKPAAPVYK